MRSTRIGFTPHFRCSQQYLTCDANTPWLPAPKGSGPGPLGRPTRQRLRLAMVRGSVHKRFTLLGGTEPAKMRSNASDFVLKFANGDIKQVPTSKLAASRPPTGAAMRIAASRPRRGRRCEYHFAARRPLAPWVDEASRAASWSVWPERPTATTKRVRNTSNRCAPVIRNG